MSLLVLSVGLLAGSMAAIVGLPFSLPLIAVSIVCVGAFLDAVLTRREREARRRAQRRKGYIHG